MAKMRSEGITHAVRVRRLRWRALCGHALMLEGDPLPQVAGEVDCMGCIGISREEADAADDQASGLKAA